MKKQLLVVMLFMVSITFAQIPTNGLVARYEFINGSFNDGAGSDNLVNNNSNIVSNVQDRFERPNNALSVNSTQLSGYTFTGTNNAASVSFWARFDSSASADQRVIQFFAADGGGMRVDFDRTRNSLLGVQVNSANGNSASYINSIGISSSLWRHVVVVIERAQNLNSIDVTTYIDGNPIVGLGGSLLTSADFMNSNAPFFISPLQNYNGFIDDVYLYDRALTVVDVADLFSYTPQPRTFHVDINASGNNDGSSWADAYTDIQDALDNYVSGDEIWVAQGTYTANNNGQPFINIDRADVKLYGGFNGTETVLSQRDFNTNETILSGDISRQDTSQTSFIDYINASSRTDNSQFIINVLAAGENLLIDGFTISDAHNISSNLGGAIIKNQAVEKLTLKNCIIKNNVCRGAGAGLLMHFEAPTNDVNYKGELTIENCRFTNNWSAFATGIYGFNFSGDLDINISNSLFDNNYAGNGSLQIGGICSSAMWLRNLTPATVTHSSNLQANITNCTFADNIDNGSGVTETNRSVVSFSKVQNTTNSAILNLKNSIFYGNTNGGTSSVLLTRPVASSTGGVVSSQDMDIDNNLGQQSWGILPSSSTGNIVGNPLFKDTTNGDYSLTVGSPAIDTGINTAPIGTMDLAGNNRIVNTTVDVGAYEFGSTTLSINDFNTENILLNIYPNPVQNTLYISMGNSLDVVEIYSFLGTKVMESTSKVIDVSKLTNGVYFIMVKDRNGKMTTQKIIKQ